MFYPIWLPPPRPRFFPRDPRLDRLVEGYDANLVGFTLRMNRRHARDLRKGIFGPKGLRDVPGRRGGEREFDLPGGWTLRLTYHAAFGFEAGDVRRSSSHPLQRSCGEHQTPK
jgi:hypothetical protein